MPTGAAPPPPPPINPIVSSPRAWWQSWWLITSLAVVVIVGAAALIASTIGGDDDRTTDPPSTEPATESATTAPPATAPATTAPTGAPVTGSDDVPITPPPTEAPPDDPDGSVATDAVVDDPSDAGGLITGAPGGTRGDRLAPVPAGEIADIGDGWRLQVLDLIADGTEIVLAENQFNDPPRSGTKFTLVEIALGYYGFDDPANVFVPDISGVAAASVELDEDCGVIPNDFRSFVDVFSGGVATGTVCFVTSAADDDTVQLYGTTGFDGPDVFLEAKAPSSRPTVMPTLRGPQPGAAATPGRLDPIPVGEPADVGEGWTLTVASPAQDITDIVASENQFNDPPPTGSRFVGIEVEYRFDGPGSSSPFEVSTKMVGDGNVELVKGCGVIPDPVDTFADVFEGGTIAGNICFVVPEDDVDGLVLYARTAFDLEPVMFATRS